MGIAAQGGRFHAISALGLLQQAEEADGHQPGVVKIRSANTCQGCCYRLGCSLALLLHPLLHLVHAVVPHGSHGPIPLLAQLVGIKARGCTEGG